MRQLALHVIGLPDSPLEAARSFYEVHLPTIRVALQGGGERGAPFTLTLMFPHADHTHRTWRSAAVQELAREAAPVRINAIVGDDEECLKQTLAYLADAPGVTGQLLDV